jgi:iron complex outermembrane receptor protein
MLSRPKHRRPLRIAALLFPLWAQAQAQSPSHDASVGELEDLLAMPVYAASRLSQKAADAPAAVTVLTAGDIRTFGWRTLAEILNAVRGVHVRNDQAYDYVGVRGLSRPGDYSSRVLLLIDGVRANENMYDSAMVGREFPLDVGLIERVEFVAGPGSALYGSNAVFGVVNVVTRSAANLRGDQLTVTAATDGTKLLGTSAREFAGGASLLLSATREHRPGEDRYYAVYDTPATNHGIATGLDAEDDAKVYARYTAPGWSVAALASKRTKEVPNAAYDAVFNDPSTRWRDTFAMVDGVWERDLGARGLWNAHVGFGQYGYEERARYEPDALLKQYRDDGRWGLADLRGTWQLGTSHRLVAGAEYQRDLRQRTRSWTLEPETVPTLDVDASGHRVGVYANDEWTLQPGLRLGLGARADRASGRDWRLTPKGSLVWRPLEDLSVKLMAGQAYRDPNVYETRPGIEGSTIDPQLRREQVRSRELAVDWHAAEALRLSGSLFHTRIEGLIEQVEDEATGLLVYRNVGSGTTHGVELESEWVDARGWRVRGSWTAQQVRLSDGRPVSNAPEHLAKLHASTPLPWGPTRLGLEVLGTSWRHTLAGQRLPGSVVANTTLQYDPAAQPWSLLFSLYNLTDARVADPGGPEHASDVLERPGRAASLGVVVRF